MQDFASFSLVGVIVGQPTWIQPKNGGSQNLELKVQCNMQGYSGQPIQEIIPVRFGKNSQEAARNLIPGVRVCITGNVSGRIWNRDRGEKLFTNFNAQGYTILNAPQRQQELGYAPLPVSPAYQAPNPTPPPYCVPPTVTDEDINHPTQSMADVPS
ncbi:MAG: hypothetical protein J5654_09525 [Victivallales bacterium]|nr:hypothetical protein [Victivallales bacterium]